MTDEELLSTPVGFAVGVLGLNLYDWQADVLTWAEGAVGKRVKGSLCTPNGAGKDSVVIAALALWWISVHKRGRVVITSKDARQIDEQTMPAIERHRGQFQGWKFNERYVETPTGGKIIAFTTDEPGRAEGFHRETLEDGSPSGDGPLLLIANEAKSIPENIFTAFDRCTFDMMLYASSPGAKTGRFYDSQFKAELGFKTKRVGLLQCPHIPKERIDDIRKTYGADSPFAKSTLGGEFMDAEGELRFDSDGLKELRRQCDLGRGKVITLQRTGSANRIMPMNDSAGWLWVDEVPIPDAEYLISCDPNTMEQGEGAKDRDNTAVPVIRKGYIDSQGEHHPDHVVAALHWPGGVKWNSDICASRMKLLADWYGDCMVVVEANNFGSALMKELKALGVRLWRRTRADDSNPNRKLQVDGWLTTEKTREHWVQACTSALLPDQDGRVGLWCSYKPAVDEFHTFIFSPDGHGEAQSGTHDDWVAAIGIGLTVRCFTVMPKTEQRASSPSSFLNQRTVTAPTSRFGACG